MDTNKRKRIRRSHRHRLTVTVLILLGASCIQMTSPFSIQPSVTRNSSNSAVVRWPSSRLHSTSSSSSSTSPLESNQVTLKGTIATATSSTTDDGKSKISQPKKNQQNAQNIQKKKQYKSAKKYNNKRQSNKQQRAGPGKGYKGRGIRTQQRPYYSNRSNAQNKIRHIKHLYSKARLLEKRGAWREATQILESILELEPRDAHSYLALARLESRRERRRGDRNREGIAKDDTFDKESTSVKAQQQYKNAREIFETGTSFCPTSTHLWHAWAMHEQSLNNVSKARQLLDTALELDPWNGYVCHAYGMLEMQHSKNATRAKELWQKGLTYQPSAALVCSLGSLYTSTGNSDEARELYEMYIPKLTNERERIEVYLAASSLEETVFQDVERASQLLKEALGSGSSVHDSRAYVALAQLGTSGGLVGDLVVKKRLKEICMKQMKKRVDGNKSSSGSSSKAFPVKDGRLFNAWAKLESKSNNLREAKKILSRGMKMYPQDHTLLQAAGNIEERLGNVTAARDLYSASLHLEPSAPTLIAYAMLELRSPEQDDDDNQDPNITMVRKLLDEALLIDPKHGPAYNAFGNLERREGNADKAKQLYEDGINANCTDAPSVYHGLAKLHLSMGEVEEAQRVLQQGLALFGTSRDNKFAFAQRNENVAFLAHTLAMIELNCNNNAVHAKNALEQGLRHCRNSPQLLLAMALCESRLGNENAARVMFERSLTADQGHAQAWQAFGVIEMQAGNFMTAKTLFECGLKNSPTHGALWQAYGTLESWKGNIINARLLFAAGIEKCPQHVPLYQAWACLELRSGDVITAKRLIGEALTRDKRNGSGWLVAAKIEEETDNHGLVGLILRRGIECAPGYTELYRALAEHEITRGKIDSARELLEKGIEINPLYAPLYHSLAELEARIFNLEGLAKLNKRTAAIFPSNAMTPSPSSTNRMQAWGNKIKQGRSAQIPDGIAALAEKIGVDSDTNMTIVGGSLDDVDPESLLNGMGGFGEEGADGLMFQQMPDVSR